MSAEYRPGDGAAVVTDGLVVLLDADDEAAVRLFRAGYPDGSLAAWVDRWAGGVAHVGVVAARGAALHVLVRGSAVVRAGGRTLHGADGGTEQVLVGETFSIVLGGRVESGPWLPVAAGVVRAGEVRGTGRLAAAAGPPAAAGAAEGSSPDDTWHDAGDAPDAGGGVVTPATPRTPATPASPASPPTAATPDAAESPETVPMAPAPTFAVVLPTGQRVPVAGQVLVGRAPASGRFHAGAAPSLLAVANPERDISATHLELRPAADHVVATDMNSTNGTVVHLPGRPPARLRPGAGMPVPPGGVIELSADVRLTVVRIDPRVPPAGPDAGA